MALVKVNIRARQTVYYNQIVEMEEEEFEELNSMDDEDDIAKNLESWINPEDVFDSDGLEQGEIYLEKA